MNGLSDTRLSLHAKELELDHLRVHASTAPREMAAGIASGAACRRARRCWTWTSRHCATSA